MRHVPILLYDGTLVRREKERAGKGKETGGPLKTEETRKVTYRRKEEKVEEVRREEVKKVEVRKSLPPSNKVISCLRIEIGPRLEKAQENVQDEVTYDTKKLAADETKREQHDKETEGTDVTERGREENGLSQEVKLKGANPFLEYDEDKEKEKDNEKEDEEVKEIYEKKEDMDKEKKVDGKYNLFTHEETEEKNDEEKLNGFGHELEEKLEGISKSSESEKSSCCCCSLM